MDFSWASNLPPQLATFLLAMLPIAELRVSIPLAIEVLDLDIYQAFLFSVLGSFVPAILIIFFIEPVAKFLRSNFKIFDKFFEWLFQRTRRRFADKYKIWGNLALMIFVAIPLPVTGVWTGSLAAWLFGIKRKEALFYIAMGTIIAGIIVSLVSVGFITIFSII